MRQLIPLIKPDAGSQGVAALSTRLTRLVLHVQKLSGIAREGWKEGQGQETGGGVSVSPREVAS
jgi:hypothetical protein